MRRTLIVIIVAAATGGCFGQSLEESVLAWRTFDHPAETEVAVLGTYHFDQEQEINELGPEAQEDLQRLVGELAKWRPTKIVLEKEPVLQEQLHQQYETYRSSPAFIDTLPNEIYQIGFRLAALLGHDRLFFFDSHPPFTGSLEGFSFSGFEQQAQVESAGLYDRHRSEIIRTWSYNDSLKAALNLYDRIRLLNHPKVVRTDAQRMHLYELRAGIGQSWIGPDWLGRWYQRNLRMISYLFTFMEDGDRILIVVGSNHKWIMDELLRLIPEFRPAMIFPTEK